VRRRRFGATGLEVSALGLGCAKIASLRTRASTAEIQNLLERALDGGVTVFDTADVYGQGDSERLLGRTFAHRRGDVVLCTKAGLTVGATSSAVRLAKPLLRPLLRRSGALDRAAGTARRRRERVDVAPERLRACLEGSLRRLRTDHVDLFLLHSPPLAALADGALYDFLDDVRAKGQARWCGVSCRSLDDARSVIETGRVHGVQVPLAADTLDEALSTLRSAAARGIGVIAREIFAGGALATGVGAAAAYAEALRAVANAEGVSLALVGTTSRRHLDAHLATLAAREPAAAC
jgi:aryl-alcohol dehydrogenase-like predicted oxidoreductase